MTYWRSRPWAATAARRGLLALLGAGAVEVGDGEEIAAAVGGFVLGSVDLTPEDVVLVVPADLQGGNFQGGPLLPEKSQHMQSE